MFPGRRLKQAAIVIALFSFAVATKTSTVSAQGTVSLKGRGIEAVLDPAAMTVDVKHGGVTWTMSRDGAREFVYEQDGVIHEVSLADSKDKTITRLGESSVLVGLNDFRLEVLIWIDGESGELCFKLIPGEEDHQYTIKGVIYPRMFLVPKKRDSYSFFSWHQGFMIPGDWDQEVDYNNPAQFDNEARAKQWGELMARPQAWWETQDRIQPTIIHHNKMGCFGAVQPRSGFIGIIDDACRMDSWMHVKHTPGEHTFYRLLWRPTMGKFSYPRIVRYHFEKDAGYVGLVKQYRKYYDRLGYSKTLAQKNDENPKVEKLRGAINLGTRVSSHDKRNFTHEVYNTFHDIGLQMEEFKDKVGYDRASVAFTGWQRYGHDQEYPDIMPPMMYAGGPLGLDSLATKVQGMGYIFSLRTDNYYDITLDSASFDEEVTIKDQRGKYPKRSTWAAGVNSFLCTRWAIRFLKRNFEVGRTDYPPVLGLLATAHPDYYWLGNYVSNWECYDPRHPLSRNENREALTDIFKYFQELGVLLSIEHFIDWSLPYLVGVRTRAVHRGVYGLNRTGRTISIPLPLWQLAFHDCAYVTGDNYLYALLWGARSDLRLPVPSDQRRIDDALLLAKLHRAVGWDKMTDHKFLSDDFSVQETAFSSGARVWVDFENSRFKITGVPGIEPTVRAAR
ncbi:DUF5696 domain-containing protein [candidate division KSB1 bacterium]